MLKKKSPSQTNLKKKKKYNKKRTDVKIVPVVALLTINVTRFTAKATL